LIAGEVFREVHLGPVETLDGLHTHPAGFLGDLVMAEIIPLPEHVLFGMLTFGVGHGCYIGAVGARGRRAGRSDARVGRAALGGSWLVALLGWLAMVRTPELWCSCHNPQCRLRGHSPLGISLNSC